MLNSKIEWTDDTWQIVTGCDIVSPGCTNCYAMRLAGGRLRNHPSRVGLTQASKAGPVWTGEVRFNAQWLSQPLQHRRGRMIFVAAHGDLFHDKVETAWLDQIFAVMALCPQHVFQVLTKRPERALAYLGDPPTVARVYDIVMDMAVLDEVPVLLTVPGVVPTTVPKGWQVVSLGAWPLANVWLGTSVEDQTRADERIPQLLATPAAVRWISAEPLLGPVDLNRIHEHFETMGGGSLDTWESAINGKRFDPWSDGDIDGMPKLDWVVVGGESGSGARPMHPDWANALRAQCASACVPFFFKQWGSWAPTGFRSTEASGDTRVAWPDGSVGPGEAAARGGPGEHLAHLSSALAGRLLDGVTHDGMPPFPAAFLASQPGAVAPRERGP